MSFLSPTLRLFPASSGEEREFLEFTPAPRTSFSVLEFAPYRLCLNHLLQRMELVSALALSAGTLEHPPGSVSEVPALEVVGKLGHAVLWAAFTSTSLIERRRAVLTPCSTRHLQRRRLRRGSSRNRREEGLPPHRQVASLAFAGACTDWISPQRSS